MISHITSPFKETGSTSPELITFTEIGRSQTGDRLRVIDPGGDLVRRSIPLEKNTSVFSASAKSLSGEWLLLAHTPGESPALVDRLFSFEPASGKLTLLSTGESRDGGGVISPTDRRMAYCRAPKDHPASYGLWLMDLQTKKPVPMSQVEAGAWDAVPSWSPDGQDIAFLQLRYGTRGISTQAVIVNLSDNRGVRKILGPEDGVFAVAYGQTKSRLFLTSKNGVEVLDLSSGERTLVMSTFLLNGRHFRLGGLGVSHRDEQIALSVFDRKSWLSEVWLIPAGVKNGPKSIYTVRDATIERPFFLANQ